MRPTLLTFSYRSVLPIVRCFHPVRCLTQSWDGQDTILYTLPPCQQSPFWSSLKDHRIKVLTKPLTDGKRIKPKPLSAQLWPMVCRRGPGCSFHFAIGLEFSLFVFCERGTIILKDALVFATPRCRPSCHGFRLSILLRYTSTTRLVHSKHSHLSRHKNARTTMHAPIGHTPTCVCRAHAI